MYKVQMVDRGTLLVYQSSFASKNEAYTVAISLAKGAKMEQKDSDFEYYFENKRKSYITVTNISTNG